MTPKRVLICDDRDDKSIEDAVRAAVPDAEITALQGSVLREALEDFSTKVRQFLKSDDRSLEALPRSAFDDHDLVFVDNNLAELEIPGARLTAEAILGNFRAFASSRYLVSLNKNPQVDFDLRYLVGDYATRADLALNEEHLEHAVLWGGKGEAGGFAPWYWPSLFDAAMRRQAQIAFVEASLDQPIVKALEIPPEIIRQLPSRAIGFLDPAASADEGAGGARIDFTSFWDHFRSSNRSLPLDDRLAVALGGSVDPVAARADFIKDKGAPAGAAGRLIAARVAAAELDIWLRRDLLGPQELLADPPHLQILIGVRGNEEGAEAWNRTAEEAEAPFGFAADLFEQVIKPCQFARAEWLPRPAFWWPPIEENPALAEFREQGLRQVTLAFAEDTRRFVRTEGEDAAWRFVPENGRPWSPRFVERLGQYSYSPESSFAR